MSGSARLAAVLAVALVAGAPARRAAAGEDERDVGFSLGYVGLTIPDVERSGGGLGVAYRRGVTDAVWLRAAAQGAVLTGEGGPTYLGQAILGASYAIDVLKYVPYVDLGIGAAVVGGDLETAVHPEVEVGVGLDVLRGEAWWWGPYGRVAAYLDESAVLSAGVRVAYRWGFF